MEDYDCFKELVKVFSAISLTIFITFSSIIILDLSWVLFLFMLIGILITASIVHSSYYIYMLFIIPKSDYAIKTSEEKLVHNAIISASYFMFILFIAAIFLIFILFDLIGSFDENIDLFTAITFMALLIIYTARYFLLFYRRSNNLLRHYRFLSVTSIRRSFIFLLIAAMPYAGYILLIFAALKLYPSITNQYLMTNPIFRFIAIITMLILLIGVNQYEDLIKKVIK